MCSVLLGIIASEEINWRERGRGGDQNKILKINKVCVCTAVTLKSDSFHLAIVFYFTLYFSFFPPLTLKFRLFGETLKGLVGAAV